MSRFFGLIFNKSVFVLLGLICLAALVWYVGPLFAVGSYKPFEGRAVRLVLICLIFGLWLFKIAIQFWRDQNLNERLLNQLSARHATKPDNGQPGDEQVAELQKRFDDAIGVLKKSKLNSAERSGLFSWISRQYIYQLPWYMFIGAPGSGKTTALINSGLTFPLADQFGKAAIRGVGGTRNCDWWFTNEAVMLDTAGRYTTQESNEQVDKAEWEGFLGLLKRFRPRQPINGVLVTVSVSDLLKMSVEERHEQTLSFKKRLNELRETLRIKFPVYVLVTKMDLLAGFNEYFSDMKKEERSQVWGFTAAYDEKEQSMPYFKSWYRSEFQLLLKRIHQGLPKRLLEEPDLVRRALMYSMPQQFAGLQDVLERLIEPVFSTSNFEDAPLLRGIYFTSGTQEGTPFDRVLGAMQRRFQTNSRPATAFSTGPGKSYFLKNLLQKVIFSESHLAGRNIRWEKNTLLARYVGYGSVALALLATLIAWAVSYGHNKDYIEEAKFKVQDLSQRLQKRSKDGMDGTLKILPVLNDARDLADSESFVVDNPPLSYRFGLYQGNKIGSAANAAYLRLLEDMLLPAIAKRIESDLRHAPVDNLEYSYEALKAYLMLHDEKHFNGDALKQWLSISFRNTLPPGTSNSTLEDLDSHLTKLLDDRLVSSPFPQDEVLITKTREKLQQYSQAQRTYSRLKRLLNGKEPPDFTLAAAAGPQAPLVFTRASGQPLNRGVRGLFTYSGYYDLFNKQAGSVATALADEEWWVLGGGKPTIVYDEKKPDDVASNQLVNDVRRLYLNEYVKTWEDFLADIHLVRASSLQKSIESARILSAPDSPLSTFIRAASKETTLVRDDNKSASIADKASDKLKSYKDDLEKVIGTNNVSATRAAQQRPELIVDTQFESLHHLAQGGPSGSAPIDSTLQLVNELYVALSATDAALKSGSSPPSSDAIIKIRAEAARLPQPVRGMLTDLSINGWAQIAGAVRGNVSATLGATVGQFCRTAFSGRYPFSRSSLKDVMADDFARMFAPGGLMDDFFQKNLVTMVNTSTKPWSFKAGIDGTALGGSAGLIAFQRAAVIRDAFFPGGSKTPSLKLEIKPAEMDRSIMQITLDIDGQIMKYAHGPQTPKPVTWPGSRGSQQVRVQLTPQLAGANGLVGDGPWALHRLFDKAQIRQGNAPEKFFAAFYIEGRKIELEVTANSVYNPFRLRELMEFQCPSSL